MQSLPRNVRSRAPRPIAPRLAASPWSGTPTPPPVALEIEPATGPDTERRGVFVREAPPSERGRARASAPGRSARPKLSPRARLFRRAVIVLTVLGLAVVLNWVARSGRLPVASAGASGAIAAVDLQAVEQAPIAGPVGPTVLATHRTDDPSGAEGAAPIDPATDSTLVPPAAGDEPIGPVPEDSRWHIRHEGHFPIKGGVLHAPSSFVPAADGSYDLIVHFHGNTWAVRESVEQAHINAMVAIVNLGIGSAVYREAYEATGTWERLLAQIDRGVKNRGVPEPKLRRIALSAWSAGYGAVGSILTFRAGDDPIDAVLMEDGIHASWKEEDPSKLKPQVLRIFAAAAREAAAGKILFTMTHSAIEPPTYAGTSAAAAYLLREVGVTPNTGTLFELPARIKLACCEHAVSPRREQPLVPTSDTRVGDLHIRGYTGETKEHHMAHLLQMAATVLPELAERWSKPTEPLRRRIEL